MVETSGLQWAAQSAPKMVAKWVDQMAAWTAEMSATNSGYTLVVCWAEMKVVTSVVLTVD